VSYAGFHGARIVRRPSARVRLEPLERDADWHTTGTHFAPTACLT
jgi:hypothetical protein